MIESLAKGEIVFKVIVELGDFPGLAFTIHGVP